MPHYGGTCKTSILKFMSYQTHSTMEVCRDMYDSMIMAIVEELLKHKKVELRGLGKFHIITRKARLCTIPYTKKKVMTKSNRVVTFRMARNLKEKMRKGAK